MVFEYYCEYHGVITTGAGPSVTKISPACPTCFVRCFWRRLGTIRNWPEEWAALDGQAAA